MLVDDKMNQWDKLMWKGEQMYSVVVAVDDDIAQGRYVGNTSLVVENVVDAVVVVAVAAMYILESRL